MATNTTLTDPRLGHWGYWRDDARVLRDFSRNGRTRVRIRVHPPTTPPPAPGACQFDWVKRG